MMQKNMIITTPSPRSLQAVTYCRLLVISKDDVLNILQHFPDSMQQNNYINNCCYYYYYCEVESSLKTKIFDRAIHRHLSSSSSGSDAEMVNISLLQGQRRQTKIRPTGIQKYEPAIEIL